MHLSPFTDCRSSPNDMHFKSYSYITRLLSYQFKIIAIKEAFNPSYCIPMSSVLCSSLWGPRDGETKCALMGPLPTAEHLQSSMNSLRHLFVLKHGWTKGGAGHCVYEFVPGKGILGLPYCPCCPRGPALQDTSCFGEDGGIGAFLPYKKPLAFLSCWASTGGIRDPWSKQQMAGKLGHYWSLNLVRVMVGLSPALTARAVGVALEYQKDSGHRGTPF